MEGASFFLHLHPFFFFSLSLGFYNNFLRGPWRKQFIFHTLDHNKISAVHTDELWDKINWWRSLSSQWAVLLQLWPERFKMLVLPDYWHHPCADNYHPLCQTVQISQQHTTVIPDSFVSMFFNSVILIRASENICHSLQHPITLPFLLGALFMHVGSGITHGWDFFNLKMR